MSAIGAAQYPPRGTRRPRGRDSGRRVAIVAARNEADRSARRSRPSRRRCRGSSSGSPTTPPSDGTGERAMAAGADGDQPPPPARQGRQRDRGRRGGARAPARRPAWSCSATPTSATPRPRWSRLVEAVEAGECDLAVAAFAQRVGRRLRGRAGLRALGDPAPLRRRAARRRSPASARCPAALLRELLPFADGFGMEIGITVDAVRAGPPAGRVRARPRHRATGRTLGGFRHRAAPAARLRPGLPVPAPRLGWRRRDPRDRPGDDRDDLPRLRPRGRIAGRALHASSSSTSRARAGSSTTPRDLGA